MQWQTRAQTRQSSEEGVDSEEADGHTKPRDTFGLATCTCLQALAVAKAPSHSAPSTRCGQSQPPPHLTECAGIDFHFSLTIVWLPKLSNTAARPRRFSRVCVIRSAQIVISAFRLVVSAISTRSRCSHGIPNLVPVLVVQAPFICFASFLCFLSPLDLSGATFFKGARSPDERLPRGNPCTVQCAGHAVPTCPGHLA